MDVRHPQRTHVSPFATSAAGAMAGAMAGAAAGATDAATPAPPQPSSSMVCSASVSAVAAAASVHVRLDNLFDGGARPASTSLACWHCAHTFEGAPCAVPAGYTASRNEFAVYGCFCSWGCAKRYMIERPNYECAMRFALLNQLARSMSWDGGEIVPNPPAAGLRRFGGPLSIEAFRAHGSGGRRTALVESPLVSWPLVVSGLEGAPAQAQPPSGQAAEDAAAHPPPGHLRGLRRPARPVAMPAEQPAQSGNDGLFEAHAERRRMASSKRKREAQEGTTADDAAEVRPRPSTPPPAPLPPPPPAIDPPTTRSRAAAAGTLARFLKHR